MKLIIGGAWQGQLEYAREQYPSMEFIDGSGCSEEELYSCKGVYDFQEFVKKHLTEKEDAGNLAENIIEKNPEIIIVSNEVGYGIVPMDAFERKYREAVGRVCTKLAAASDTVVRVVCGIGTVIKSGGEDA